MKLSNPLDAVQLLKINKKIRGYFLGYAEK